VINVPSNSLLTKVNGIFFQIPTERPEEDPVVNELYQTWLASPEEQKKLLHTTYHAIPKLEVTHPLSIKW
jgi:hypothetical protein